MGTFLISMGAIASLLTVSVSACTCLHQHDETDIAHSAYNSHEDHHDIGTTEDEDSQFQTTCDSVDENDNCTCEITAAKLVVRAERIKLDQHSAVIVAGSLLTPVTFSEASPSHPIHFAKPEYLSDSFYDLAPKRGPPRI
jgi:hypothetical protein